MKNPTDGEAAVDADPDLTVLTKQPYDALSQIL
jgi:hypothetical protein